MNSLKTLSVNAVQDAITSRLLNSIIQQASEQTVVITEKAMVSAKDALTNKISEITAHHDSYQQKTDERLDILCEKLSTIAKNANALITDSRFNVSSDISGGRSNDPESIRANDLDSASRTLGFFPVTSTDSSNAAAAFMAFLMLKLQIPKGIVITINPT